VGKKEEGLQRHLGLLQATALNVTMVVGAGVFLTIPYMLKELPGPYALLGWLAAGALVLVDSLVWAELGAALPGSGGSYVYLLECYGRQSWGRLMAFLFIWQFLLSGPLELASGLIAMDTLSQALDPAYARFNLEHTLAVAVWPEQGLSLTFSPARFGVVGVGLVLIALLYRRVAVLGRLTVALGLGVLVAAAWILIEGATRFDAARFFDYTGTAADFPAEFPRRLAAAVALALYSYLGYYNVCYLGDEVRDPGRTIPRSILLSAVLVFLLFAGLHLALLGTVSWHDVPADDEALKGYSLAADFMRSVREPAAARLLTVLIMASCFASAFSGLLGYSRIPYGAARAGHFFAAFGRVHPAHRIPHVALLLVGGLTLLWSFFDFANVVNALITTRILVQFVAQIVGVALLRRAQPDLPRPFRLWLYPLPCGLALAGWLAVFAAADWFFLAVTAAALAAGGVAFLAWSRRARAWPFAA
jgi:amino acid transporter